MSPLLLHRARRLGFAAMAAALLAGCAGQPAAPETVSPTGFTLRSPGRADNAMLTRPYAGQNPANANCVGENRSPALAWANVPAGTRSFAIVMDDQAGRAGLGVNHWVAYGIPADLTALAEGEATAAAARLTAGKNTLGMAYLGPCPPRGNAPQHYVYTLIATTLEPGVLPPGLTKAQLMEALAGKTRGAASLVLRFAH